MAKIIHEVFDNDNVVADGIHMNLAPPAGIVGSLGLVIEEPEAGIFVYNRSFDLNEELADCKDSASNIRRTQVRDTVKEVKVYLKTYLSDGMDISYLSTKLVKAVKSWQNCSLKYRRNISKNERAFKAVVPPPQDS
ncbi:hypothetical protein Tco_0568143 [Tanacetum coccineum]